MPRRPRCDTPDQWHHVMNRGIARRSIFECDEDFRFFLALVAREVRAGRLEVHAFSLLLTHFHLLVRCPDGQLGKAMHRLQMRYARWFNRSRRRDGPLFRGRYHSKSVDTLAYRRNVVTYIHDNPVDAGRVTHALEDEWTSAGRFAGDQRPRWLATDWIDDECARRGEGESRAERLYTAFPSRLDPDFRGLMARDLCAARDPEEEDGTLQYVGDPKVVAWAVRKAELADATRPFRRICPASVVEEAVRQAQAKQGPLLGLFPSRLKDAWPVVRAALFTLLCGTSQREIGLRVARHPSTVSRDVKDHARLRQKVPWYARLADRLTIRALVAAR